MARLTDRQRADRALIEEDFQRQIVGPKGIATILGWLHVHFRPAMTKHGWRTAGSGELAKGWPDLVLLRPRDRRLIFAELKRELEQPSVDQAWVLQVLRSVEQVDVRCGEGPHLTAGRLVYPEPRLGCCPPSIEVFVWRPSQLEEIAEVLL